MKMLTVRFTGKQAGKVADFFRQRMHIDEEVAMEAIIDGLLAADMEDLNDLKDRGILEKYEAHGEHLYIDFRSMESAALAASIVTGADHVHGI